VSNIYLEMDNENIFEESKGAYNQNRDFTGLICWQNARDLKIFFYKKIIAHLPETEKYNLNSQIRRAAIIVNANIAEGYGRYHYQEEIQFYRISRGSIFELKDHLLSCFDLNYIEKQLFDEGIQMIETAIISLNGFINYIKKEKEQLK